MALNVAGADYKPPSPTANDLTNRLALRHEFPPPVHWWMVIEFSAATLSDVRGQKIAWREQMRQAPVSKGEQGERRVEGKGLQVAVVGLGEWVGDGRGWG